MVILDKTNYIDNIGIIKQDMGPVHRMVCLFTSQLKPIPNSAARWQGCMSHTQQCRERTERLAC